LTTVPGQITHNGAKIQILDLPGIIAGAKDGKGRGRQVIAVARTCNLIFIVLDVLKPLVDLAILTNELEGFGIRLNKTPPRISISKKENGGILITNSVPLTELTPSAIKSVMSEYRINNAQVSDESSMGMWLIDRSRCISQTPLSTTLSMLSREIVYTFQWYVLRTSCLLLGLISTIKVLNKIDGISIEELDLLYKIPDSVPISSREWLNIDELLETMWDKLDLVRV